MAAPRAHRARARALLLLTLALALLLVLGLGAAISSSSLSAASRPSVAVAVAAAGSSSASRDVPRHDLELPAAAPLGRHVLLALAAAPAVRRLFAYPAESVGPRPHGEGSLVRHPTTTTFLAASPDPHEAADDGEATAAPTDAAPRASASTGPGPEVLFPQRAATCCPGGAANAAAKAVVQRGYGGHVDFTGALNGTDRGAASLSSAPRIASSRSSSTAAPGSSSVDASRSREVPRPGSAPRLHRTTVAVLELPAPPVRRHIFLALAIAPAGRRLLAYRDAEIMEAHGHGAGAAAAPPAGGDDAGREAPLPPRAPGTTISAAGAGEDEAIPGDSTAFVERDVAGATNTTDLSLLALRASSPGVPGPVVDPARRPRATPGEAEQGCDTCEVLLPPRAACTIVTYVGGAGAGALEFAHTGHERVFVVREHTGGSNNTGATATATATAPGAPDDDDYEPETDSDCDGDGDSEFSQAMEQFCAELGHATAMNAGYAASLVVRVWGWFIRLFVGKA